MAVTKIVQYKGMWLETAYCRIANIVCNKDLGISFQIDVYYNEETRRDAQNILTSFCYTKPIDLNTTTNIYTECYSYLKNSIPEWTDSIDC